MKVYIEKINEFKEVEANNAKELLNKLKINPTTVIITVNNELVTEDFKLNKKDNVKLLSVISGG